MKLSSDILLERKSLKKQATKWRLIALIILIIAVISFANFNGAIDKVSGKDHIARIEIKGIIQYDKEKLEKLESILENKHIKGVLLFIDSPGGTALGGETYYNVLKKISAKLPLVTILGDLATSAGYMIALPSTYIVAHNATITGSIGVLIQLPNLAEVSKKIGVKVSTIKSGALKGEPNMFEDPTPESIGVLQAAIDDFSVFFKRLVVENRKLSVLLVDKLADGRIYTANQAKDLKLIDAVADEEFAQKYLREKLKDENISIVDYELEPAKSWLEKAIPQEKIQGKIFSSLLNTLFSAHKLLMF